MLKPTTRSTRNTGKKKCGSAACKKLATHVALDGFFCVYLCDACSSTSPPKGNWQIKKLTAPGATTYLAAAQ